MTVSDWWNQGNQFHDQRDSYEGSLRFRKKPAKIGFREKAMQIEFREKAAKLGFRVGQGGAKNDVVLHDFFFVLVCSVGGCCYSVHGVHLGAISVLFCWALKVQGE
jgi:hypothetical protein